MDALANATTLEAMVISDPTELGTADGGPGVDLGDSSLTKDLPKTLKKITGLPCLLVSEKDGRDNAVRLVEASFNDEELIEDEIVEISVMKTVGLDLMKDKRLPGAVSSFLYKHAISEE